MPPKHYFTHHRWLFTLLRGYNFKRNFLCLRSALNPIIYGFMSKSFRDRFYATVCKCYKARPYTRTARPPKGQGGAATGISSESHGALKLKMEPIKPINGCSCPSNRTLHPPPISDEPHSSPNSQNLGHIYYNRHGLRINRSRHRIPGVSSNNR